MTNTASETTGETAARDPELWTYIGQRRNGKGQLRFVYVTHHGDTEVEQHWFGKALLTPCPIGGIVRVWPTDDGVHVSGEFVPQYQGMHGSRELTAEWTLRDRTHRVMHDAQRQALRDKRNERRVLGAMTLDEVAREYRNCMTSPRQHAMLAVVLGFITSTRTGDSEGD